MENDGLSSERALLIDSDDEYDYVPSIEYSVPVKVEEVNNEESFCMYCRFVFLLTILSI